MLERISKLLNDPGSISIICSACVILYYGVSALFISANKDLNSPPKFFKKNGIIDWVTSTIWITCTVVLIYSLFNLCIIKMTMSLGYLVIYYFLFIFLFSIIYGIIDWHTTGLFEGIPETGKWLAEARYLILSIQTQTTLGYSTSKPKDWRVELLTCVHALLGIFFMTIFISLSINAFKQN